MVTHIMQLDELHTAKQCRLIVIAPCGAFRPPGSFLLPELELEVQRAQCLNWTTCASLAAPGFWGILVHETLVPFKAIGPQIPIGIPLTEMLYPDISSHTSQGTDVEAARRPVLGQEALLEYDSYVINMLTRAAQDQEVDVQTLHPFDASDRPTDQAQLVQLRLVLLAMGWKQLVHSRP